MSLYDNYLKVKPTRWGVWLQVRRTRAEWKIIRAKSPASKSVLEIGPGHGVMAKVVSETGYAYLAVESNGHIANSIRSSGFLVCRAIAPPIPIQSCSIDIVYAAHVIEHLPDPRTALFFAQEAHRILRDNGILFLSAPDIRSFGWNYWDADYTHSFPVTPRRIRQLLADANFEIITEIYFSGPFHGPISALVSILVRIMPSELFFITGESSERMTRLRLTLLRNICVLARKK